MQFWILLEVVLTTNSQDNVDSPVNEEIHDVDKLFALNEEKKALEKKIKGLKSKILKETNRKYENWQKTCRNNNRIFIIPS